MRYARHFMICAALVTLAGSPADAQAPATQPKGGAATSAPAPTGDASRGKVLFERYGCYQCHGFEGQGAGTGTRLAPNPLPLAGFIRYVRAPRGVMPPYTQKLLKSEQDLIDIHAYLVSRPKPASSDVLKELGLVK